VEFEDTLQQMEKQDQQLRQVFDYVRNFKDPNTGEAIAEDFVELPSKSELPAYYTTVSQPRDLAVIDAAIQECRYYEISAFVQDMMLVFQNAFVFNEDLAPICQNAAVCWCGNFDRNSTILPVLSLT
jgi:hypothetical protein